MTAKGLSVTDFVHLLPLIPLVGDPDGQVLTRRRPLLVSLLEHDNADPHMPRRVHQMAGPSGRSVPAKPEGRKGRARVSWRHDGR